MSAVAMELESLAAASIEYTSKIEKERTRSHKLMTKMEEMKVTMRRSEEFLLEARKDPSKRRSSTAQLESRLQSLRTKYGEASRVNRSLMGKINDLRVEKTRTLNQTLRAEKDLERARDILEGLKIDLQQVTQELNGTSGKLEALKIATLQQIAADQAHVDSLSDQIALVENTVDIHGSLASSSHHHHRKNSASEASLVHHHNRPPTAASPAVQKDLAASQILLKQRADDLEKLFKDRVSVIRAMDAIHQLRDEFGIATDDDLINEFQASEDTNYAQCQETNRLLAELAVVEQENDLLTEMVGQETTTLRPFQRGPLVEDDDDVAAVSRRPPSEEEKSPEEIAVARRKYEKMAATDDETLEDARKHVLSILLTLTSRTKTKNEEVIGLEARPLAEMLSFIENAVDTFLHLQDVHYAPAAENKGPPPRVRPPAVTFPAAPVAGTKRKSKSDVRVSRTDLRKQPNDDVTLNDDDDDDGTDNGVEPLAPQSVKDMRRKAKLRIDQGRLLTTDRRRFSNTANNNGATSNIVPLAMFRRRSSSRRSMESGRS